MNLNIVCLFSLLFFMGCASKSKNTIAYDQSLRSLASVGMKNCSLETWHANRPDQDRKLELSPQRIGVPMDGTTLYGCPTIIIETHSGNDFIEKGAFAGSRVYSLWYTSREAPKADSRFLCTYITKINSESDSVIRCEP